MPFADYLAEAVLAPLGMAGSELRGLAGPRRAGRRSTTSPASSPSCSGRRCSPRPPRPTRSGRSIPDLAGIVPGVGRFDPCPWGLGFEIRGDKSPHWTGATNDASTYGHFGGAGTMMWVDPAAGCALVALTDRPFDDWSIEAMRCWPALSDAVVAEVAGRHDVRARRPGPVGDHRRRRTAARALRLRRRRRRRRAGRSMVMLDGELGGDVIDLEQLRAGVDHQRRAAPRRPRPDRRSRPAPRPRPPVAGRGRDGRPRRRRPRGPRRRPARCPTTAGRSAALTSGGEQYVVRASADARRTRPWCCIRGRRPVRFSTATRRRRPIRLRNAVSSGARRSWPCPGRRRRTSSPGRTSCPRPAGRGSASS